MKSTLSPCRAQALVVGTAFSLCLSLQAQIVPSGYENIEGEGYCQWFGSSPFQRFQLLEGEAANRLVLMRRVGFRRDDTAAVTAKTNEGRAWTRVTIDTARTRLATITDTFASNYLGKAARVFDARFSLPTYTTNPTSYPTPFAAALSFPLRRTIAFSRQEFLLDWHLYGGTRTNGSPWPSNTPLAYHLDAALQNKSDQAIVVGARQIRGRCAPTASMQVWVYGEKNQFPGFAGRANIITGGFALPPDTACLHAVSIGGSDQGTNIGAICERLHVDLSQLLGVATTRSSRFGTSRLDRSTKYQPAFHGVRLYCQIAFDYQNRGRLALTQAVRADIPPLAGSRQLRRASVFASNPTHTRGFLRRNDQLGGGLQVPIVRYSAQ